MKRVFAIRLDQTWGAVVVELWRHFCSKSRMERIYFEKGNKARYANCYEVRRCWSTTSLIMK
jgi:6-pyruvoyl-tetrahydropterin synthase